MTRQVTPDGTISVDIPEHWEPSGMPRTGLPMLAALENSRLGSFMVSGYGGMVSVSVEQATTFEADRAPLDALNYHAYQLSRSKQEAGMTPVDVTVAREFTTHSGLEGAVICIHNDDDGMPAGGFGAVMVLVDVPGDRLRFVTQTTGATDADVVDEIVRVARTTIAV